MEFKKYNSIENSYRTKEVEKIQTNFPGVEFLVQEKVHGSNFSVYINCAEIKCAKRSGFIPEDEIFYNHKQVLEDNLHRFQTIQSMIRDTEGIDEIVLIGELCGGSYPHKDVSPVPNQTKVQGGVFYHPRNLFYIFDVKFDGKLINIDDANDLLDPVGLFRAKTLCRGTLEDCLAYSNKYISEIPSILGLPEIKTNICEGNVIKPVEPLFHENGNRVILKNKNEKFSEKTKKVKKPEKELPPHISASQQEVAQYITENRLRNVISKIGEVTHKDFGKMLGLFSKDVLEDFVKESDSFGEFSKDDQKLVNRFVNGKCVEIIRKNLMNIVDGEF